MTKSRARQAPYLKTAALLTALASFAPGEASAQTPGWRGPPNTTFGADSAMCRSRAARIAGTDTGTVVGRETARCLVDRGWRPVVRYQVESGCSPIRVELLDTVPYASELVRAIEERVLEVWRPTVRDRRVQARVAFRVVADAGVARLEDVRSVAPGDEDEDARPLFGAFTMPVAVHRTRFGFRSAASDAIAVVRGDCLAEVADEGEVRAVTGAEPEPTDQVYFEFQVEKQVAPMPGNPAPRHPDMLRSAKVEGDVLVQFVVDTTGRADMSTFKVLKSSHDLFTDAVRSALPSMRFYPAEISGRKVRQMVQMPFQFTLTRPRG